LRCLDRESFAADAPDLGKEAFTSQSAWLGAAHRRPARNTVSLRVCPGKRTQQGSKGPGQGRRRDSSFSLEKTIAAGKLLNSKRPFQFLIAGKLFKNPDNF